MQTSLLKLSLFEIRKYIFKNRFQMKWKRFLILNNFQKLLKKEGESSLCPLL